MAFLVSRVVVKEFLGNRAIDIQLDRNINFLVGKNGTGKTSFVRLLSAALQADREELSRVEFSSILVYFTDEETKLTPQLQIRRLSDRNPAFEFSFRINGKSKFATFHEGPFLPYGINQPFPVTSRSHDREFRSRWSEREQVTRRRASLLTQFRETFLGNIQLTWLPLLRTRRPFIVHYDDDEVESIEADPINEKINDIRSLIIRYFSRLESIAALENKHFQRDYLLSLLNFRPTQFQSLIETTDENMYDKLEDAMHSIFHELGFQDKEFSTELEKHFSHAKASLRAIGDGKTGIKIEDYFSVADTSRLNHVVSRFQQYEENKAKIFEPKSLFVRMMNEMLINKSFSFSTSNEPRIRNKSGDVEIDIFDMSSGEKQLFVLFSETLLQERKPYIYMADEPELSLHVEWQENIVRHIRSLNPACQIIFATHSPDIVSEFQDRVIDFGAV